MHRLGFGLPGYSCSRERNTENVLILGKEYLSKKYSHSHLPLSLSHITLKYWQLSHMVAAAAVVEPSKRSRKKPFLVFWTSDSISGRRKKPSSQLRHSELNWVILYLSSVPNRESKGNRRWRLMLASSTSGTTTTGSTPTCTSEGAQPQPPWLIFHTFSPLPPLLLSLLRWQI